MYYDLFSSGFVSLSVLQTVEGGLESFSKRFWFLFIFFRHPLSYHSTTPVNEKALPDVPRRGALQ